MTTPHVLIEEGHQRLIRARHGYVLYNRNDTVIGRLIEAYGEYFETEVNAFRRFVTAGDIVLDVGSNIGTHSLALARLTGPTGMVFAFEPQRIVFQTLCANMAINSLDNVHCVNAAVGDASGWLSVRDPDPTIENNFGGATTGWLTEKAGAWPTQSLVLDEFLNVDRLSLIKIDVEGMESAVLRGARRHIARFQPILYVENAFPDKSPELLSILAEYGYRSYWHLPLYVTEKNYFSNAERLFPIGFVDRNEVHLDAIGFAVNLLCVHKSRNLPIQGLRPVAGLTEHPFKRECVGQFAMPNSNLPIIQARD